MADSTSPKKDAKPKYTAMVVAALKAQKRNTGTTKQSICSSISATYPDIGKNRTIFNKNVRGALEKLIADEMVAATEEGFAGSNKFKLTDKGKAEPKKAAKKAASPMKKAASPKMKAAKAASPKKKSPIKKAVAKKAAAKKAASPKKAKKTASPKKAAKKVPAKKG